MVAIRFAASWEQQIELQSSLMDLDRLFARSNMAKQKHDAIS